MNHPVNDASNRGGDDVHALSGAYAVDALDPAERTWFEEHLRECADCREEVDGLRETVAQLGSEDAIAPSAAVRDAVLGAISTTRPLPPLPSPQVVAPPIDLAARRRTTRTLPLLVAAAAVLIAAVGGLWAKPWADDKPVAPQLTAAEQVLAADDAARIEKSFPDGATATIVVSRSVGRAVILTSDMPHAPDGKAYQLWLQTPAGELKPDRVMPDLRTATVVLEGDASRATGVGITVEPDGGSPQPTSEPIAFFTLDT